MMGNQAIDRYQERYRIQIGDTERSVEEIVADLKNYGEPIIQVALETKTTGSTAAGSTIIITAAADTLTEQTLANKLNQAGGCMYQIAAVTKLI